MLDAKTPEGWAIRISRILNAALGKDHFPIEVAQVAKEISRQLYPDAPITRVTGDKLRSFEGALVRAPSGRKEWGILFNTNIASAGRINFTLAHEFGHYLLHRASYPEGFDCSTEDMVRWDTEYGRVEHQANVFASYLLMPLDDFRRQLLFGRLQSLLWSAQGNAVEMARSAGAARDDPATASRYPDGQVFHGAGVGHPRRTVETPAPGCLSPCPSALPARGRGVFRAFPEPQGARTARPAGRGPAHGGGDPRTGESLSIPDSTAPVFKAGKGLRDAVSGGNAS